MVLFHALIAVVLQLNAQSSRSFAMEIAEWREQRMHELKAPNGWINLAGLYWIEPGENKFGSDSSNDFVCNLPGMPAFAGTFILTNGNLTWKSEAKAKVMVHNRRSVFDTLKLSGSAPYPKLFSLGSFRWNLIQREEKLGIRLRDLNHPALKTIKAIDYYNIDSSWKIPAKLITGNQDSVMITNMIGQTHAQKSPGRLVFSIGGTTYTLDALESGHDELFLIFGDLTNGGETYASGRYLYVAKPNSNGETFVDFNKAINPPCVFTPFATCPIPPRQNRMPIAVNAGEKMYKEHE